nr:hypothetical protein [Planctomycetota bacterium]
MNLRLILHIFRKDGLEILRDKRTLFVNIGLPVLLYPLIALFVVQMIQLTRAQHVEPARIAGVEVPAHLSDALARAVAPPKD